MKAKSNALIMGSIIGGVINAIINAVIYWFQVKDKPSVLLTDNLISSTEHTVFSSAVPLATSLAFILSSITYFSTKVPGKPPYFPSIFLLALRNAVFAFGAVTIFAILLQRNAGSISVSPMVATVFTGIIAGIVSYIINYQVKKQLEG